MDKKVLSEINRSREIMGLKQLVINEVVRYKGRLLTEQEMTNLEVWLPAFLQDMREPFWKYLKSHDFNTMKYGSNKASLAKAIAFAYNKIYGEDMNLDSLHIFKDKFLYPKKISSFSAPNHNNSGWGHGLRAKTSTYGGTDMMVLSNAPGAGTHKVIMTFDALNWNETELSLDDAIDAMNRWNIIKAGTMQIAGISIDVDEETVNKVGYELHRTWKATSMVNQLITAQDLNSLILFSPSDVITTIEGEGGGTITIAADVVKIPGDQAFDDVAVEPNSNVVKKALEELVTQAEGKPVKTIEIHSSASDDQITDPDLFRTNMRKYGYGGWGDQVIQKNDDIGDFTEQEFNNKQKQTGNMALAIQRGKNVAKLMKGIDVLKNADIEYVYSIGNKGDDSQFANLLIKAMEDDTIEVLKGGTQSTTSTKRNTRQLEPYSLQRRDGGRNAQRYASYSVMKESLEENIIDIYKATFTFDMTPLTKEQKVMSDVTRKKRLWPPSEWFKSKEARTKKKHTGEYETVDDEKAIKTLTDKQKIEKAKQEKGEF